MDPEKEKLIEENEKTYTFLYETISEYKGEEAHLVIPDKIIHRKLSAECGFILLHDTDRVLTIGSHAFLCNKSLKSVVFPAALKRIEAMAFWDCNGLEQITLNEGLTFIGKKAFFDCEKLKSVTIPESVTCIEKKALGFTYKGKMADFTIYGKQGSEAERYAKENGFSFYEEKDE